MGGGDGVIQSAIRCLRSWGITHDGRPCCVSLPLQYRESMRVSKLKIEA